MTLATRPLRIRLQTPAGAALAGAKVTLQLSAYQVDGTDIVPLAWDAIEDPAKVGDYLLDVWPNTRGDGGTHYDTLVQANEQVLLRQVITVTAGAGEAMVAAKINAAPWPPLYEASSEVQAARVFSVAAGESASKALAAQQLIGPIAADFGDLAAARIEWQGAVEATGLNKQGAELAQTGAQEQAGIATDKANSASDSLAAALVAGNVYDTTALAPNGANSWVRPNATDGYADFTSIRKSSGGVITLLGSVVSAASFRAILGDVYAARALSKMFSVGPGNTFRFGSTGGDYTFEIGPGGPRFADIGLPMNALTCMYSGRALAKMVHILPGNRDTIYFGDSQGNYTLELSASGLSGMLSAGSVDASGASIRNTVGAADAGAFRAKVIGGKSQIQRVWGDGEVTISDGTANDSSPLIVGSAIRLISDREDGTDRSYRMLASGKSLVREARASDSDPRRFAIFVMMGQSLAAGGVSGAIHTANPANLGGVLSFNGGNKIVWPESTSAAVSPPAIDRLVPLVAANKQTYQETLAYRLYRDTGLRSLSINVAVSGAGYASIKPGTAPWSNAKAALANAFAILTQLGYKPEAHLMWQHGEFDGASAAGVYYAYLSEAHKTFLADIRATGFQQSVAHMFLAPPPSAHQSRVPIDMWRYSKDVPTAHMVGPILGDWFADYQHPTNLGAALIGDSIYFRTIKAVLVDGLPWMPLQPDQSAVTRSGAVITVPVQGAVGALRNLANTDVPTMTDWGLEYTDNGSPPAISSVAISGSNLVVTLASTPTGANKLLRGAWTRPGMTAAPADHARINVADSDTLLSTIDSRVVPKWMVPFEITVP